MDCTACQETTAYPTEKSEATPARTRRLAVTFQFDNLRPDKARRPARAAIAVPAYSRIVYRDGVVSVR
jgi:hypothetical protein